MFETTRTRSTAATLPVRVLARSRHTFLASTSRSVTGPGSTLQTVPRMVRATSFQEDVMYELMGRAHAALVQQRGQGTVEYVGLILLLGVILAGVVAAGSKVDHDSVAKAVATKLKTAIDQA